MDINVLDARKRARCGDKLIWTPSGASDSLRCALLKHGAIVWQSDTSPQEEDV